jgi:hypothetical protein
MMATPGASRLYRRRPFLAVVVVIVVAGACLPNNSVRWAWHPVPDGIACVVPIDDAPRQMRVTEDTRRACVANAAIIEPELPVLTIDALRLGPPSQRPFRSDEDVYCRLNPRPGDGGSLKFRCLRTYQRNQLFDEDGELAPEAATFDADDVLLDARG